MICVRNFLRWFWLAPLALGGCATVPAPRTDDPYEKFNRKMYAFNQAVDEAALRPAAVAYRKVTSQAARQAIANFFENVETPVIIGNDVLQWRPKEATLATSRLVINSTIGILGFFDPASRMGIHVDDTDFGVTLARWGVGEGPYLVLPILGSSSARDAWRVPVDSFLLNPLFYFSNTHTLRYGAQYAPTLAYFVTLRSAAIETEPLLQNAYDPYLFYRDAYRQHRIYKIYGDDPPASVIKALQGDDDGESERLLEEQHAFEKSHRG